ncbi:MAG: ABC transporter permease subunit [Chthoniobacterales bacterium]
MNPFHLLHLEWKKFAPNGTFRILALFYVVFYILSTWLTFLIGQHSTFSFHGASINPAADLFTFPRLWELIAYIGSWLNLLVLGLMGVFLMTLELNNRTLRQNVISGLSRSEVFVGKISAVIAIAVVATCCYLLLGAVSGGLTSTSITLGTALPAPDGILRYFVQSTGYLLLGLLIGLFIRQTALATIVYVIFFFIEFIFSQIVYWTIWKSRAVFLLPAHVLSNLIHFPVPKMVNNLVGSQTMAGPTSDMGWIFATGYIVVFAGLIFWRLRKIDL